MLAGELMTGLRLPDLPAGCRTGFRKGMARRRWSFALAAVAVRLEMADGAIADARVALGGVAAIPPRARAAEAIHRQEAPSPDVFRRAGEAAVRDAEPLAHNAYEVPLTRALVRKALESLAVSRTRGADAPGPCGYARGIGVVGTAMGKNISDAVREVCLALPEVHEVASHGSPEFRVGTRAFATYVVNHHGDGRIALWLNMPPGAQQMYTEEAPEQCFVPPYVGPRGWLGVHLDRGMDWGRIGSLVREAYRQVAGPGLLAQLGPPVDIEPPTETLDPEDFDPLSAPRAQEIIAGLRKRCLALPEVSETTQFGNPCWRAGKKTFCSVSRYHRRLQLYFWVGAERQSQLTMDERYTVPAYMGHNGWIALDAEDGVMWDEVEALTDTSYRHFALKRMLKALEEVAHG